MASSFLDAKSGSDVGSGSEALQEISSWQRSWGIFEGDAAQVDLWRLLRPCAQCPFSRFGDRHDGGFVLCNVGKNMTEEKLHGGTAVSHGKHFRKSAAAEQEKIKMEAEKNKIYAVYLYGVEHGNKFGEHILQMDVAQHAEVFEYDCDGFVGLSMAVRGRDCPGGGVFS